MARLPKITVPGIAQHCVSNGVEVWSYYFMPNHVHLILVPRSQDGLSRAIGETHRRYSGYINARLRVTGHLFQGRFGSVAMDEAHLLAAFRYVALNPVKAKLVATAAEWRWSSTRAHLLGRNDELVTVKPLLDRIEDVLQFLNDDADLALEHALVKGQTVGRPLMGEDDLVSLEKQTKCRLRPARRGRPRRRGTENVADGYLGK